jgi:CheY-like chemotaxis protein
VSERLSVLIAEDSAADRMLLSTIVSRQGHRSLTAGNGLEAVALYEQERPQLVLMDALMPVMDGFEAARRIKEIAGDALVPIIFLTSLSENEALVRCLEVGDDVLAKPYNRTILEAKIRAMDRLRRLQDTVLHQRDLIAVHNEHLLTEQRVAKAVFDKVAHSGCLAEPNIRYVQSPFALFNGDLLLAAYHPTGAMYVFLGDFTGHGLPAAIGAMPLAEVFYGMTARGYSLQEILREINAKLKRILPVGMFCCATMLNLDFPRRTVQVWSGGLPDGYLLRAATGELTPLNSRHLPLGILDPAAFDETYEIYPLQEGDRAFLFSDGVLETHNACGEPFGVDKLQAVFRGNRDPAALFDEIRQALADFSGEPHDDVSMVEVQMLEQHPPLRNTSSMFSNNGENSPLNWSAHFEFRPPALAHFNPLPHLLHLLMEVHVLRPFSGSLFIVLRELYANALEHGVLGLDSALKRDAKGFEHYYLERGRRLASLAEGYVRLHMDIAPTASGGRLRISVEDSGPGFDPAPLLASEPHAESLCGRGMHLVRQLANECHWAPDGKGASAEFHWSNS